MEGQDGGGESVGAMLKRGLDLVRRVEEGEEGGSGTMRYEGAVEEAMRALEGCLGWVQRGEGWSSDETASDLSAERLRFVTVAHHLAQLVLLRPSSPSLSRRSLLLRAQNLFREFLDTCHRLLLLTPADAKVWERGALPAKDPAARREEKLESGRREMANKKRLRAIREQLAENEKKGLDADTNIDEEVFRESVLLEIQLAIKGAIDGLHLIEQELPLAERMEQMKKLEAAKEGTKWAQRDKDEAAAKAKEPAPANPVKVELPPGYTQTVGAAGQVTITKTPVIQSERLPVTPGSRAALQAGVFRPDYNMATMSVEQAGDIDYMEMMERSKREKEAEARRAAEPDEDDVIHYDTVTVYKDRDWDSFKDDNPTGSGNTTGNLG